MVNVSAEKDCGFDECPSISELPGSNLRHNFRLGDITWVKPSGSSWWPAQVIDESCIGAKLKKKFKHECLVRLYGTCQRLYIDPWKSNAEFEMMLKQENKNAMEAFHEVFQKELSNANSSCDYDEETVNSKGGDTKLTTKEITSRKVRKQEGLKCSYKGAKESATYENQGDETERQCSEEQDQDVGSTATTQTIVRKRRRGYARRSSSSQDEKHTIDKVSSESSVEASRDRRQKQNAHMLARRKGLRRSARSNAKGYLDAADVITASEDATEDSLLDGTSAPHAEIKAMVRDILFKDIINREHDAEMAYVDEVINDLCNNATEDIVIGGGAASTEGRRGINHSGSGVKGESRVAQRSTKRKLDQVTETMQVTSRETMKQIVDATPSRDAAMKEPGQLSARQVRQIRIMQSLGLIAPSGSPFGRAGVVT